MLARFFDPADGQVTQRHSAFVDEHGVLAHLLKKDLGLQNSVLAEALARQVGETSPLFKKLSPRTSTGLVKVLEAQLRAGMGESHAALVQALDPFAEDGAVARFLNSLRDELKSAEEDRQKQLAAVLAALDANDEGSLLSRLVRKTPAHIELMLNPARGTLPPADAASEIQGPQWVSAPEPGNSSRPHPESLMIFLPIIANNLGKIAAAAATTLGLVGYVNRERIGRWLSDEEPDSKERKLGRPQDLTGVLETAESIKNLHSRLTPDELDRKHTELSEKLTAMNAKTMSDFRGLINEAQSEVITSMAELEGQLDAQRSETRALGEELREAVADLARRQDAVEQFLHGKDKGEIFAVPGRQRTAATTPTPSKQEETGKKPSPNGRRKGNGSTAPETRAP